MNPVRAKQAKVHFAYFVNRDQLRIIVKLLLNAKQPRSQGLSSLPFLVVGTETLVAGGHVTFYPSKTGDWVGTQVHLVERTIKYPTLPADFSTTQILGGHVTSRNQGLCSND